MRAIAILFVAMLMSACTTVRISEKAFLHPDASRKTVSTARFDPSLVQAAIPSAVLAEETVAVESGLALRGLSLRRPEGRVTVLYFGGSGYRIDSSANATLAKLGSCPAIDVTVFDYRGYGRSPGVPTVDNMKSDALQLFDAVNARAPGKVWVHGQSFGSFMAAYVAQQRPVAGLVLEATATNASDWAHANVPWYARLFVTLELSQSVSGIDNALALGKFNRPALVLAGTEDLITPPDLGRRVFEAIPSTAKKLIVAQGAGHENILRQSAAVGAYCEFITDNSVSR